jgi:hypothetical protein
MSLYDIVDNSDAAVELSKGFLKEANLKFEQNLREAEDLIQRFWYRNRDEQGEPALEGDEPTGIQILQAMGTNAESVMTVAFLRVQMLVQVATALGKPELVDMAKVSSPYELTFNEDGSLNTWTLKS